MFAREQRRSPGGQRARSGGTPENGPGQTQDHRPVRQGRSGQEHGRGEPGYFARARRQAGGPSGRRPPRSHRSPAAGPGGPAGRYRGRDHPPHRGGREPQGHVHRLPAGRSGQRGRVERPHEGRGHRAVLGRGGMGRTRLPDHRLTSGNGRRAAGGLPGYRQDGRRHHRDHSAGDRARQRAPVDQVLRTHRTESAGCDREHGRVRVPALRGGHPRVQQGRRRRRWRTRPAFPCWPAFPSTP